MNFINVRALTLIFFIPAILVLSSNSMALPPDDDDSFTAIGEGSHLVFLADINIKPNDSSFAVLNGKKIPLGKPYPKEDYCYFKHDRSILDRVIQKNTKFEIPNEKISTLNRIGTSKHYSSVGIKSKSLRFFGCVTAEGDLKSPVTIGMAKKHLGSLASFEFAKPTPIRTSGNGELSPDEALDAGPHLTKETTAILPPEDGDGFDAIGKGTKIVAVSDINLKPNQWGHYFQNGRPTTFEKARKDSPYCFLITYASTLDRVLKKGSVLEYNGRYYHKIISDGKTPQALLMLTQKSIPRLGCRAATPTSDADHSKVTIADAKKAFEGLLEFQFPKPVPIESDE